MSDGHVIPDNLRTLLLASASVDSLKYFSFFREAQNSKTDFKKEEIRIVIVGDIFEKKIKADNESKDLFHEFMNYINAIGKTIIVAGNHDMLENNQDRMDSISPTFSIKGVYPNITYADRVLNYKSGYIKDDNIIWVLYSMFDKFMKI